MTTKKNGRENDDNVRPLRPVRRREGFSRLTPDEMEELPALTGHPRQLKKVHPKQDLQVTKQQELMATTKTEAVHPELAAALRVLKEARGVSEARLAQTAGVSRRHVSIALAGGNITVAVLKKLMRALGAETVPIGDLAAVSGAFGGVDGAVLVGVADQIERGTDVISAAVTSLRKYATRNPPTPASSEQSRPD